MRDISSFLLIPNGSRVLPLSMRYASLAFRTLSLLDLMSSSEISVMSLDKKKKNVQDKKLISILYFFYAIVSAFVILQINYSSLTKA